MAELAGVSTATVSRVINNENGIKPSTRDKVREAIASSGYRVNTIARSLKTNRTRIIGLITPEIANDFFMNIARGIEGYLKDFGYSFRRILKYPDFDKQLTANCYKFKVKYCVC
ncbi:MAG: LacI family DNA-binding transcriptional regulator [Spirochaetales bacterium]|nr:LacI family DNA-binding transcriptional regulator [Spirochaetales bacterium]